MQTGAKSKRALVVAGIALAAVVALATALLRQHRFEPGADLVAARASPAGTTDAEPSAARLDTPLSERRETAPAASRSLDLVRVRVLESDGSPAAGLRVFLSTPAEEGASAEPASGLGYFVGVPWEDDEIAEWQLAPRGFASGLTSSDGLVELEIPEEQHADPFEVGVKAPPFTIPARRFEALPEDWVEIVLPACGGIEVLLSDASDGQTPSWRGVDLLDEDGFQVDGLEVKRGKAVFRHVPLGRRWSIEARDGNGPCASASNFEGPSTRGEIRTIALVVQPFPIVRGRVVDETGRSLASSGLVVEFSPSADRFPSDKSRIVPSTVTDEAGRFELALPPRLDETGLEFAVDSRGLGDSVPSPRRARLRLPEPLERGRVLELGTIVMQPEPLALAGRVLDSEGNAASSARLRVMLRHPSGRMEELARGLRVDEDGRFELRRATPSGARLVVIASAADGSEARARDVRPGEDELALELAPAAR